MSSFRYYCLVLLWLVVSSPPSLAAPDCDELCEKVPEGGLVGDCCSSTFCRCSGQEEDQEEVCGGGQFYCPQYGGCLDFYGQQCDGERFDCCEEITTTTRRTTTTAITETDSTLVTDSLDCSALCLTEPPGALAGDCCSPSFCVCSPAGAQEEVCGEGQLYCPQHQTCLHFYGQQCDGQMFDCCASTSTTFTFTSTVSPGSTSEPPAGPCSEVCGGKTGVVGECCGSQYCDCDGVSDQPLLCQPGHYFCPAFSACLNMYGSVCSAALFDCCL